MPISRRVPQKGFNNFRYRIEYAIVNLGQLERFEDGTTLGPDELKAAGLLRGGKRSGCVKVLGEGALSRKLVINAHKFSRSARAAIEAAGGEAREIAR